MMLHGENVNGIWYPDDQRQCMIKHQIRNHLYGMSSQVIYYWTCETAIDNEDRAYIIVYHGGVNSKMKIDGQSYLSFRAVKNID